MYLFVCRRLTLCQCFPVKKKKKTEVATDSSVRQFGKQNKKDDRRLFISPCQDVNDDGAAQSSSHLAVKKKPAEITMVIRQVKQGHLPEEAADRRQV